MAEAFKRFVNHTSRSDFDGGHARLYVSARLQEECQSLSLQLRQPAALPFAADSQDLMVSGGVWLIMHMVAFQLRVPHGLER